MNKMNVRLFEMIAEQGRLLSEDITEALRKYRKEMETVRQEAQAYKAEKEFIAGKQTVLSGIAQNSIKKAQMRYSDAVGRYVKELREQLETHVSEPILPSVREQLLTMQQFHIKPARTQIEAILTANKGNPIGLAVIGKVLEETGADYRLKYRTVQDYEKDLEAIERTGVEPIAYDSDYHTEFCEIFRDQYRKQILPDGRTIETGQKWDSVALLIANGDFSIKMNQISSMAGSWATDVSHEKAEMISAQDSMTPKQEPVSGTSLEENNDKGLEIATELGKRKAQKNTPIDYPGMK